MAFMKPHRSEIEEAVQAKERLRIAAGMAEKELFLQYGLTAGGLDEARVRQSRGQYGGNSIARKKRDSLGKRLLKSFVTPFTIVLFVLAGISLFTDILLASPQNRSYTTVGMAAAICGIRQIVPFLTANIIFFGFSAVYKPLLQAMIGMSRTSLMTETRYWLEAREFFRQFSTTPRSSSDRSASSFMLIIPITELMPSSSEVRVSTAGLAGEEAYSSKAMTKEPKVMFQVSWLALAART